MNILIHTHISPFQSKLHFGGAESSLKLIASLLVSKGHKVVFVSNFSFTSFKGYRKKNRNGIICYEFGRMLVPFRRNYSIKSRVKAYHNKIKEKILIDEAIEIVHTYYNPLLCEFYLNRRKNVPFKLVVRVAGLKWYEDIKANPKSIAIYQKIFNESDLLNFISKGLLDQFNTINEEAQYHFSPKKYFVGDIGVDLNAKEISLQAKTIQKNFTLAMVSRFSKYQKRQDILIQAFASIKELPIQLILIGNGENQATIQKLSLIHI